MANVLVCPVSLRNSWITFETSVLDLVSVEGLVAKLKMFLFTGFFASCNLADSATTGVSVVVVLLFILFVNIFIVIVVVIVIVVIIAVCRHIVTAAVDLVVHLVQDGSFDDEESPKGDPSKQLK